jgi:DNA-directed RNA polymerase alpha subunit
MDRIVREIIADEKLTDPEKINQLKEQVKFWRAVTLFMKRLERNPSSAIGFPSSLSVRTRRDLIEFANVKIKPTAYSKDTNYRDVYMSIRAYNLFRASECETLGQIAQYRRQDLMRIRNVGKVTVDEIENILNFAGLKFES